MTFDPHFYLSQILRRLPIIIAIVFTTTSNGPGSGHSISSSLIASLGSPKRSSRMTQASIQVGNSPNGCEASASLVGKSTSVASSTGNALFLLNAAKRLKKKKYHDAVIKMAGICIRKYFNRDVPLPNGYLTGRESPCQMQGSSGIGYFFLKLFESGMKNNLQLFPGMIG